MHNEIPVTFVQASFGVSNSGDNAWLVSAQLKNSRREKIEKDFELTEGHQLLKTTVSVCPQCLQYTPAAVYQNQDRVFMKKRCDQHGLSDALIENDASYYHLSNKDKWGQCYDDSRTIDFPEYQGCCADEQCCTTDTQGVENQSVNKTCTVLIEITNACNLQCRICYADANGDIYLPYSAVKDYILNLIEQKGSLDSVQLTGGEASMHPRFWEILDWLYHESGVASIYLPTNGIEFAKGDHACRLVPYVDKVLVLLQIDGGSEQTNQLLRRSRPMKLKQRLITRLNQLGIKMQLTMAIARGISEEEIAWVVRLGQRYKNIKVIGLLPVFFAGRYDLEQTPMNRITLSDVVKGVVSALGTVTKEEDFMPIPCSHPNCGWTTLFARRFGIFRNIIPYIDYGNAKENAAYRTTLSQSEVRSLVGTQRNWSLKKLLARLGRHLIRSKDVFGIAIKPFMDCHTLDLDRVSSCCHHIIDTRGRLHSFCEYNVLHRATDDWSHLRTSVDYDGTA